MVDYYETRAKNHLSQYLNLLVSKQEDEKKVSQKIDYFDDNTAPNLIGIRKRKKFSNIGKMGVCLKNILLVCPRYWLIFGNVVQFHEIFVKIIPILKLFCLSPRSRLVFSSARKHRQSQNTSRSCPAFY